jgi:hypothetical protein
MVGLCSLGNGDFAVVSAYTRASSGRTQGLGLVSNLLAHESQGSQRQNSKDFCMRTEILFEVTMSGSLRLFITTHSNVVIIRFRTSQQLYERPNKFKNKKVPAWRKPLPPRY